MSSNHSTLHLLRQRRCSPRRARARASFARALVCLAWQAPPSLARSRCASEPGVVLGHVQRQLLPPCSSAMGAQGSGKSPGPALCGAERAARSSLPTSAWGPRVQVMVDAKVPEVDPEQVEWVIFVRATNVRPLLRGGVGRRSSCSKEEEQHGAAAAAGQLTHQQQRGGLPGGTAKRRRNARRPTDPRVPVPQMPGAGDAGQAAHQGDGVVPPQHCARRAGGHHAQQADGDGLWPQALQQPAHPADLAEHLQGAGAHDVVHERGRRVGREFGAVGRCGRTLYRAWVRTCVAVRRTQDKESIASNIRKSYPPFADAPTKSFQFAFKVRVSGAGRQRQQRHAAGRRRQRGDGRWTGGHHPVPERASPGACDGSAAQRHHGWAPERRLGALTAPTRPCVSAGQEPARGVEDGRGPDGAAPRERGAGEARRCGDSHTPSSLPLIPQHQLAPAGHTCGLVHALLPPLTSTQHHRGMGKQRLTEA